MHDERSFRDMLDRFQKLVDRAGHDVFYSPNRYTADFPQDVPGVGNKVGLSGAPDRSSGPGVYSPRQVLRVEHPMTAAARLQSLGARGFALLTLPACKKCNTTFSFDENVTKTIMSLISEQADLAADRQPGRRVDRALSRDRRLRALIDACWRADGKLELTPEVSACIDRVFRKTVQGLYFGLYERIVPRDQVEVLCIRDQRHVTPDEVIDEIRPPLFRDISDEPLPELTPSSWMVREPVYIMELRPVEGSGPPIQRLFRMARETPVDWVRFQPGIFSFAFVKSEDGRAVCILDLWETLVVAVAAPWPDGRGPIRRGRKNPFPGIARVQMCAGKELSVLTENDVVDAVAAHLPSLGYAVESKCTTVQTGVDIVAKKVGTDRRLRIEAKGGTSSKEHTARYSLGFNPGQVKGHVSRALYEAAAMLCEHDGDEVALALPDDEHHRARVQCIRAALDKLGISVFFVAADKSVQVLSAAQGG